MKLFIAASPKTGNNWLEGLLAEIYELPILDLSGVPQTGTPLISQARFVTHQHYVPTPELLAWGKREGVRFLTMTRHPGDVFVSLYHYVNNFAPIWREKGWIGTSPAHVMIGEDINSPIVLEFMRTRFRSAILGKSLQWLQNGEALVVRYEDLHRAPVETLRELTDQIEPVELACIEQAIEACHIDKMRKKSTVLGLPFGIGRKHFRKGKIGSWREELSEAHMAILREQCAREMALLDYDLNE